ncbi:MAG TPA: GGDEF domain-containing protein [Gaiellaceae bacterium]
MSLKVGIERYAPDPVTGFGSRASLLADLRLALEPGSDSTTLAIFGLDGFEEFERVYGTPNADEVLGRLAKEFAYMIEPAGVCYAPRRREFCALFSRPLHSVSPILAGAAIALRREGAMVLITTAFGVAVLPEQADEAISALAFADERLEHARRLRRATRGE